jgi:hypothetical protein
LLTLPESERDGAFLRGDHQGHGTAMASRFASVVRFDLPQARSYPTAFCKRCGSPVPHLTRSGREAIVPAGGFDDPLGASPDRHARWSSRADWCVHGERLPVQV